MANRNWPNGRSIYIPHVKPCLVDCNFIVDSTNGNGLGIRSLKGHFVQNVFMNTSAAVTGTVTSGSTSVTSIAQGTGSLQVGMPIQGTGIPAGSTITAITSSSAVTISQAATSTHSSESITYQGVGNSNPATPNKIIANPNPAAGTIVVQLYDPYWFPYTGGNAIVSPVGTPVAVNSTNLTPGVAYVITTVGATTAANWATIGLSPAQAAAPTVGMAFIAAASGAGSDSTARVAPTAAAGSGIFTIETVGDSSQSSGLSVIQDGFGAQFILQCRDDSSGDASQIAAPANNTVISLWFLINDSSVPA